jgi:hypothetical protein
LSVCHVQSTPAGLLAPDQYSAAAWPLVGEQQRLPRKVFRRSIAWLSVSLSTLRRVGYPTSTQDSLPAVGQTLLDGLSTRRVPMKGFRIASLHFILLSQALLGAITSTEVARAIRATCVGRCRQSAAFPMYKMLCQQAHFNHRRECTPQSRPHGCRSCDSVHCGQLPASVTRCMTRRNP